MTAFRLILPLALVGALGVALAPAAQAAPVASAHALGAVQAGGVNVHVGYRAPRPRVHHYDVDHVHGGYWTYRTERVFVPGRVIGYDHYGHPILTPGRWTTRTTRVWVPVVHRHHVHEYVAPRGGHSGGHYGGSFGGTFGGSFRYR